MPTTVTSNITVTDAIFCEDVRPEMNGKWTLLGVFPGESILVADVPATLRLGLWIVASVSERFKGPLHIRIRLDDETIGILSGEVDAPEKGTVPIAIGGLSLPVPRPGTLHVDAGSDTQHWTEIMHKRLAQGVMKDGVLTGSIA